MTLYSNISWKKIFYVAVIAICTYLLFANITYTDDYAGYQYSYYNEVERGDVAFSLLESYCLSVGLEFQQFYNVVIAIQVCVFMLMLVKLRTNTLLIAVMTITLCYVQMANQIRYFIAFPLFFLSINEFISEQNYIKSLIYAILSFFFHSGIIALFLFIPYYYALRNFKSIKSIIIVSIALGIIIYFAYGLLSSVLVQVDDKYSTYLDESTASLLGMLFVLLFPSCPLFFIIRNYAGYNGEILDVTEKQMLLLSLFPIVWMVASFSGFQIINARYVNCFVVFWLTTILQFSKNREYNQYMQLFIVFTILFIIKYVISIFLFNGTEIEKLLLIWRSKC